MPVSDNIVKTGGETRFNSLLKRVQSGDESAIYDLAYCYQKGIGTRTSLKTAKTWYYKAAIKGDVKSKKALMRILDKTYLNKTPEEQYELGMACFKGDVVPKSKIDAIKWFRIAANKGHVDSQYMLYVTLKNFQNRSYRDDSIKWLKIAARNGHHQASETLEITGKTNFLSSEQKYDLGCRCLKDKDEDQTKNAVIWFQRSAEKGNFDALIRLYEIYSGKYPYHLNQSELNSWCQLSKKAEVPDLKSKLEKIIEYSIDSFTDNQKISIAEELQSGHLLIQCHELAKKLLMSAVTNGSIEAAYQLGMMYKTLSSESDRGLSFTCLMNAAEKNHHKAQYEIGQWYEEKANFSINKNAFQWYKKSALNGNKISQYKVGLAYEFGFAVPQSYVAAAHWYLKAAEQGQPEATYKMAVFYENGTGVQKSNTKSFSMYNEAAHHGNRDAENKVKEILDFKFRNRSGEDQYSLATQFYKGMTYVRSVSEAFKWYCRAAENDHTLAQYIVGTFYEKGLYVERSMERAERYYLMSAEKGYVEAQYRLGLIYKNKAHSAEYINKELYWLRLAANKGHKEAKSLYDRVIKVQQHGGKKYSKEFKSNSIGSSSDMIYIPDGISEKNRYSVFPDDYNAFER